MEQVLAPETWPEWQSEIISVSGPPRVSPGAVVQGKAELLGFHVSGHSTSIEVSPTSYEEDVVVGVQLRVRYEVVPAGKGAAISRTLIADLPGGPMGRILSFFLARRLRKMQVELLGALAARAERQS